MEGYWDDTIFHTQNGDTTGTGEGGKIYGEPLKDKFHTRLLFCRRDLIAMANAGKDNNTSQFLFTLGSTSELQSKHTIFGKVTEETIYNMLKLDEALVDENDRLLYHPRLLKSIILNKPFSVIISRTIVQKSEEVKDSSETQTAGVKYKSYMFAEFSPGSIIPYNAKFCYRDFNVSSYGEKAEEDEEESVILNKKFSGEGKSAHDHLSDSKLSSQPAVEPPELAIKNRKEDHSSD
ncbi:Peptidyl-prolyl cis-trans isomerase CWC27 like protein [Eufriesea mexicana]|uniref:Peptidyl-prolyl cis-trans isomerase n=1 Tax=Eufriesea mexicana TaxID=516756 RepID=A0A310SUZ0_9HYME|nr:Peptidyl-prolyl cis-trans isomerase CWC27 like protein [Eufriesea mexicana]